MPMDSVASLVEAIRQHRLLEPAQLDQLTKTLQIQFPEPRALARELLQRNWLTAYQVNQVFQGYAGNLVIGPHILLEKLGEGGMGLVYRARHVKLGRIVAIKIIRKDRLANQEAVRRFHREIQLAAQLSHPNVVLAYDADQSGDRHLIVMEYVEGIDLGRLVKQRGALPVPEACDYIRQGALGLQHAFEHKLVHRDIKPTNLLLTQAGTHVSQFGTVKLLDLGLARTIAGDESNSMVTQDGQLVGTPDFIAPEQARNAHAADIRADLYSLGCTFFYLLTGKPPFEGGTLTEKLLKHHWDAPPRVEEIRPDVPPVIAAILRKLLAKDPDQRYQLPNQLAKALEAALAPGGFDAAVPAEPIPISRPASLAQASALSILVGLATPVPVALPQAALATATVAHASAPGRPRSTKSPGLWLLFGAGSALLALGAIIALALFVGGARETSRSNRLVATFPTEPSSPLDRLTRDAIPPQEPVGQKLKDHLVAIAGEHRGRHFGSVNSVAFSPEGNTLASASDDGLIRLWDTGTLQTRGSYSVPEKSTFLSVAYCPNSKYLAGLDWFGTVYIWDTMRDPTREATSLPHEDGANAIAFSPKGTMLAVACEDKSVQLYDFDARGNLHQGLPLRGQKERVTCVAFSPDGQWLACGSEDHSVQLWDVSGSKPRLRATLAGHSHAITAVAFAPDNRYLATGSDGGAVLFWDLNTEKPIQRGPSISGAAVTALAFDRQWMYCSRSDGTVGVYEPTLPRPKLRSQLRDTTAVQALACSGNGQLLATGSQGGLVRLWDNSGALPKERVIPAGHSAWVTALAFSPEGQTLSSGGMDRTVRLWDMTGLAPKERAVLDAPGSGKISSVSFSSDGKRLAATNEWGNGVRIWDLPATVAREWPMSANNSAIASAAAFSPDHQILALAGQDSPKEGVIRLLDVTKFDPKPLQMLHGHTDRVVAISFSGDGKLLASSGGSDQSVRIWDVPNHREIHRLNGIHSPVGPVALSADGRRLAFANQPDANTKQPDDRVWLWDLSGTPRQLPPLPTHNRKVLAIAFSSDSQQLATSDAGGQVILWDANGRNVMSWSLPGAVTALAFAPDNRHLALGNSNGTIYILRLRVAGARPK